MASENPERRRDEYSYRKYKPDGEERMDEEGGARSQALERARRDDELDTKFGFEKLNSSSQEESRLGWLLNMHPTTVEDKETAKARSAVDFYFVEQDGSTFKATIPYNPYFYLQVREGRLREVEGFLRRQFDRLIEAITPTDKIDLDMKNHLAGLKRTYLKVEFSTVQDLVSCKSKLLPIVLENKERGELADAYAADEEEDRSKQSDSKGYSEFVEDLREYDVPYYTRVSIDRAARVGHWYQVTWKEGKINMERNTAIKNYAQPRILAFDIETTKLPLKFPDASIDQVMMISYMLDGQGYLITNREIVGADIEDFEYTPDKEYPGPFHVWNEKDEKAVMERFVNHICEAKPTIFVTYNGDFFDWKFLNERSKILKMPLSRSIGLRWDEQGEYFSTRFSCHLDCIRWVIRDSYLPQGSHGLKAVTKAKLKYDPLEVDPERMLEFARERPQQMASYSVSDAVATYYLYMKYIHTFVFSLCTIVPMHPDDVLRKGSGTLCEALLMVEAFKGEIIFPNKKGQPFGKLYEGHLIESETYVGGHVEALEVGVYRADLDTEFEVDSAELDTLINDADKILRFACTEEANWPSVEDCVNFEDVKQNLIDQLSRMRDAAPHIKTTPLIYHVDVAAMYPNIILTNRLQPISIVDDTACSACLFNQEGNNCQRPMEWEWRVDYFPAKRSDLQQVKNQLELEMFPLKDKSGEERLVHFYALPQAERNNKIQARLKEYCRKMYKKTKETKTILRKDTVCMRENPFYVDTVRDFRDRRYHYKSEVKRCEKEIHAARAAGDVEALKLASDLWIVNESLQIAHKCILNSFYGYVMRKGARWHSMEMAAIVTHTGSNIIKRSKELVEKIGKPLELDTDGIWCALPKGFPETVELKSKSGLKYTFNFICTALNVRVHEEFRNDQYQSLKTPADGTLTYETKSVCSIAFEVDGPYLAMILPTSQEEGKQLKKRYAIFNKDGKLHELKGFEIKRRGELKMIKDFQSQIFTTFLAGSTLQESYAAASRVASHYLDIIDTKGESMVDDELLQLISESRNMSKNLEEYGMQKSAAITTAKRLSEFLNDSAVKEKGVSCRFVISKQPEGRTVTERAIPTEIFAAGAAVQQKYLRRWCADNSMVDCSIRAIVDWEYYRGRLTNQLYKLIILPALAQGIPNPLPRVPLPDWVLKRQRSVADQRKQRKIKDMFGASSGTQPDFDAMEVDTAPAADVMDIEDAAGSGKKVISSRKKGSGKRSRDTFEGRNLATMTIEEADEAIAAVMAEQPRTEKEETLVAWRKKVWKLMIARRKRRKLELGAENSKATRLMGQSAIGSFFVQSSVAILTQPWQILQIAETGEPGLLKVWLMTNDPNSNSPSMLSVDLKVDRRFYLNSYKERGSEMGNSKLVRYSLPRNRTRHHLYEIEVPERQYLANMKLIEVQRTDPDVEGLYETKVPLLFRAVAELGAMCKVRADARSHLLSQPWELRHLEPIQLMNAAASNKRAVYLRTPPKFLFLHYCFYRQQHVFSVWFPAKKEIYVAYTALALQTDVSQASLNSLNAARDADVKFADLRYETTLERAMAAVDSTLTKLRAQMNNAPTVLILQGALTSADLRRNLPTLDTMPQLRMSPVERDNAFPTFKWLSAVCNVVAARTLKAEAFFDSLVPLARYSQIPLCNFPPDRVVYATDILMARRLRQNDTILWYSDSGKPDIGGHEEEDSLYSSEIVAPEKVYPDCVETVSIHVDLQNLAVNTILQFQHIPDLDAALLGLDAAAPDAEEDSKDPSKQMLNFNTYDESILCARAFRVLKNLVFEISADTVDFPQATPLVDSVYRWITSPQSRLYDPALHKLVQKLIKKVFLQLIAEMKRLGARIVYASFNKLIIATDKHRYKDAKEYFKFIKKTIVGKRELFQYLHLEPIDYWELLLFKDVHNYVAVDMVKKKNIPDILEEDGLEAPANASEEESAPAGPEDDVALASQLLITDYFPGKLKQAIVIVLVALVEGLCKAKREVLQSLTPADQAAAAAHQSRLKAADGQLGAMSAQERQDDVVSDLIAEWHRGEQASSSSSDQSGLSVAMTKLAEEEKKIMQLLASMLYETCRDVRRMAITTEEELRAHAANLKNVVVPGFNLDNPTLEFIKVCCYMLSLKKSFAGQIQALKRNLLREAGVREFAPEAEFVDPGHSYLIPNVTCESCNYLLNLDLLRDARLIRKVWNCPHCRHPVDRQNIEQRLIEVVRKRSVAFQTQDLVCEKCREVKADNMLSICSNCSASFRLKQDAQSFKNSLTVFSSIARFHEFKFLQDTVDWILQVIPLSAPQK